MQEWSGEQLIDYINRFSNEEARDQVFKTVVDSQLLKDAIETQAGSQMLNAAIDLIRDSVMKIVSTSLKETSEKTEIANLKKLAMEIRVAHKQLLKWAATIKNGEEHIQKMKGEGR